MSILALVALIIGLSLVLYGVYLEKKELSLPALLLTLGTTVLISGFSAVLYELFARQEFINTVEGSNLRIFELLQKAQTLDHIGLLECHSESNQYSYKEFLTTNRSVTICINDGRTWISRNSEYLKVRFENATFETTFIIMHPESPAIEIQADKTKTTTEALKRKTPEALDMIKKLDPPKDRIKIFGHNYYNPQSVYLGDNYAIVTPYYTSSGRRDVPLFRFVDKGDTSYFHRLKSDLDQLKRLESKEIPLYT